MAVTAKFSADFSGFIDAIDKAELALVDFDKGASKVESTLNKMVDNFSGRKLIQEASLMTIAVEKAGGVSTLTAAEIEKVGAKASEAADKMTRLGYEVPAGLQKLVDATHQTGNAWQEFVGKLNIEEALSHPLGTAQEAMGAFAETIGPVAVAALGLAAGVVAVGAAIFELTKTAAEAGGKLNDMSEVTGIAVPQLSRLSNASTLAGTDIQTLSNAVFQMQKNMAESPDKFENGLKRIGLNFADFKALSPDEQLRSVAEALKATEDPVQRNGAGFEMMGRQFRDIEPALLKLNDALAMTADIHPWTEEQAREAEAFEMQLSSLKVHAEALGLSIGRDLIAPIAALVGGLTSAAHAAVEFAGGFGGILTPIGLAREAFSTLSAAMDVFLDNVDKLPTVTGNAARGVAAWKDGLKDLQLNIPNVNDALRAQAEVVKDLDPATKKLIDAYAEMNAAGVGWQGTLDSIDGTVVEAIKFYLEAGVSQKALADGYGLTAVQIKAVASALKDTLAAEKTLDEFRHIAHNRQVEIIRIQQDEQTKLLQLTNAGVIEALNVQTQYNNSIGRDAAGAIQVQDAALQKLTIRLADITAMHTTDEAKATLAAAANRTYTDELLKEAKAHDTVAASTDKVTDATVKATAAIQQFRGSVLLDTNDLATLNAELHAYYDQLASRSPVGDLSGPSAQGPRILTGHASGVMSASQGHWATVGEFGPEQMYVPKGSSILPSGSAGGGTQTINILLDGRTVASVVNDTNTRTLRQLRQLPSN